MHPPSRKVLGGGRWGSSSVGGSGDVIIDISGGGHHRRMQRNRAKMTKIAAPLAMTIVLLIIVTWLVVCIQFYINGFHIHDATPEQQQMQMQIQQPQHQNEDNTPVVVDPSPTSTTPEHYMAFSTACSSSQDWQSYMFFYFAYKVSQPGYVIRIASGCSEQQQNELLHFHKTVISKLSPNFSVYFTPDFSDKGGDDYKYFNKPFGLQHWFQFGLKYEENLDKYKDAIFMVLDPDMMLMRPLTYDFTDSNVIIHKSMRGMPTVRKVLHGQPWASIYGFGAGPFRVDVPSIFANDVDSPALHVTEDEKVNNYAGGPPYMATGSDMYAIVNKWCEVVVAVHHAVPKSILAEMYGWSLAAAHLKLPHTLAESFMISDVDISSGEGWPLIDVLDNDEISEFSTSKVREDHLPYVIHYCQNYWLGKWFIGKYRLASNWLACERPLLLEPPKDIGQQYDYYIKPGGVPYGTKEKISPLKVKRNQFMISQIIARYNDAATWIKGQTCDEGTANYEKSFIFHFNMDPENIEGGEKKIEK